MHNSKSKAIWLTVFLILILMMVSIGGITRLTRSGLSIVEWKPIVGIIPPLTEAAWQEQFSLYQNTPEFKMVNSNFGIAEYKSIFMWEYLHRVLGRIIFIYTALGGFLLWRRKLIEGRLVVLLSSLIAMQGLVGWLMVKSGLHTQPRVSPFMLALHFFFALFVASVAYQELSRLRPQKIAVSNQMGRWLFGALGCALVLQLFYGCLTSGFKAGHIFNTFPLMGHSILPSFLLSLKPVWLNLLENPATIQWIHRWLGVTVYLFIWALWLVVGRRAPTGHKGPFLHLLGISSSQVILGIATLLLGSPVWLAAIHQLIAVLIFLGYLNIAFRYRFVQVKMALALAS